MQSFDPVDQPDPTSPRKPLLTQADLIAIALVGIGIITVTSVLLVLLF